jgi:hypothetical protein
MAGLQFFGKQAVLNAYRSRGISTWAIFQQKNLNFSGDSDATLSAILDQLAPYGAGCMYTLKVYSGEDPNEITERTDANGSFNFKLAESGVATVSGPHTIQAAGGTMEQQILAKLSGIIAQDVSEAMDRRLNGVEEDDEEVFSIGAIAKPYIQEPMKLIGLIRELKGLFNGVAPQPQQPPYQPNDTNYPGAVPFMQQPGKVAGVKQPVAGNGVAPSTDEESLTRLGNALDILGKADPHIVEHLEKLAEVSQTDPDLFKSIIKKFNFL